MWAICAQTCWICFLDPENATGPPTAPTEIAKSNPSNVHLQTNALSPSNLLNLSHHQISLETIKYLEQLLNSSLATVAAIQFSGNTLANVLTPRAYDTNKALYALAALDIPTLSTTPRESDTPTRSTFSDIGNNSLCSSNRSPPLPNSNLVVPCTGRIVIYIYQSLRSMSYIFRWPDWRLSAVFFIFFSICLGIGKGSSCKRPFF